MGNISKAFKSYYEINWTNENPTSPLETTTEATTASADVTTTAAQ